MRGTLLIALVALLIGGQVAVAQQLKPGSDAPVAETFRVTSKPSVKAGKAAPAKIAGTAPVQGQVEVRTGLRSQIGGLPFTGIDMLVISGAALLLTGMGFTLQRLSM